MNGKLMVGMALCFVLVIMALMPLAIAKNTGNVEQEQEISKLCFSHWAGNYCIVPVKTAWGNNIGWKTVGEFSEVTECVYSSGDWLIDSISFRTGKDYSRSFGGNSAFSLNCGGS